MRKTLFYFSAFHQRQRKMRTTGLLSRHSQNGKTKNPHTFCEQRRTQNFSRAFDCGCSYFSQQKHEAVRCVQSSGVSPAALRRCKAVYPCAYSRNKAKKRFVLVQRFMPAYALCRHIIKLYKNQYGRGQVLAWCECAYFFSQQKHATVRCVRNGSAQPALRRGLIGFCVCKVCCAATSAF